MPATPDPDSPASLSSRDWRTTLRFAAWVLLVVLAVVVPTLWMLKLPVVLVDRPGLLWVGWLAASAVPVMLVGVARDDAR